MEKKKMAIIAGASVLAISLAIGSFFLFGRKELPIEYEESSNGVIIDTPPDKIDDVRENLKAENLEGILKECTKLNEKFSLTDNYSTNLMRNGFENFTVLDYTNVTGVSKTQTNDIFYASIADRAADTPDLGITITTTSLSADEVEDIALEIIEKMSSEELKQKFIDLNFGETNSFQIDNADRYEDIYISKSVEVLDTSFDASDIESVESIEGENISIYNYGLKFNLYEGRQTVYKEYGLRDYDKQLFMSIPIFASSESTNIDHNLAISELSSLYEAKESNIIHYYYETTEEYDRNQMVVELMAESGETVKDEFVCELNNISDELHYMFRVTTFYNETADDAFDDALKLIKGITEIEVAKDKFEKDEMASSEVVETYLYNSEDFTYSFEVTIEIAANLGYYAVVRAY